MPCLAQRAKIVRRFEGEPREALLPAKKNGREADNKVKERGKGRVKACQPSCRWLRYDCLNPYSPWIILSVRVKKISSLGICS